MGPNLPAPSSAGAPAWLRPLAWGCAATVLAMTLALVWTTCSVRRLLPAGLGRLTSRVMTALPVQTPAATRQRLQVQLACAVAASQVDGVPAHLVGEMARACADALADERVTSEELARIVAAAERVCRAGAAQVQP